MSESEKREIMEELQKTSVFSPSKNSKLTNEDLYRTCFYKHPETPENDSTVQIQIYVMYQTDRQSPQGSAIRVPKYSMTPQNTDRNVLGKLQSQLNYVNSNFKNLKDSNKPIVVQQRLSNNEMMQTVTLQKTAKDDLFALCIYLCPTDELNENSCRSPRINFLQRLIACCVAWSLGGNILEKPISIEKLTLFMFAWLTNLSATLLCKKTAASMEKLLIHNLKQFCVANTYLTIPFETLQQRNKAIFFYQFLGTIAVKSISPLQKLIAFMHSELMLDNMDAFIDQMETGGEVDDNFYVTAKSPMVQTTKLLLQRMLRIYGIKISKKPTRNSKCAAEIPLCKLKAQQLIVTVDVFMSFFNMLLKKRKSNRCEIECLVQFDTTSCKITKHSEAHRCYTVERDNNFGCKMSITDLNDWLKHMAMLQLDKRNIHQNFQFKIRVSDSQEFEFGLKPRLDFDNTAKSLLTFLLLTSEYIRAGFSGKRSSVIELRERMTKDKQLDAYIDAGGFVLLDEKLLHYVVKIYNLTYVQGMVVRLFADKSE